MYKRQGLYTVDGKFTSVDSIADGYKVCFCLDIKCNGKDSKYSERKKEDG